MSLDIRSSDTLDGQPTFQDVLDDFRTRKDKQTDTTLPLAAFEVLR